MCKLELEVGERGRIDSDGSPRSTPGRRDTREETVGSDVTRVTTLVFLRSPDEVFEFDCTVYLLDLLHENYDEYF